MKSALANFWLSDTQKHMTRHDSANLVLRLSPMDHFRQEALLHKFILAFWKLTAKQRLNNVYDVYEFTCPNLFKLQSTVRRKDRPMFIQWDNWIKKHTTIISDSSEDYNHISSCEVVNNLITSKLTSTNCKIIDRADH